MSWQSSVLAITIHMESPKSVAEVITWLWQCGPQYTPDSDIHQCFRADMFTIRKTDSDPKTLPW